MHEDLKQAVAKEMAGNSRAISLATGIPLSHQSRYRKTLSGIGLDKFLALLKFLEFSISRDVKE